MASKKRQVFIEEYLQHWNATKAAEEAGYAHPGQQGHRLLKNVEVQRAIEERIAELKMSTDEILLRLADQARGSMADFIEATIDGGFILDLDKAEDAGKLHLIKSIAETKHGVRIELYNAQAALEILLQHAKPSEPKEMVLYTPEQWKAEAARRLAEAQETMKAFEFEGDDE